MATVRVRRPLFVALLAAVTAVAGALYPITAHAQEADPPGFGCHYDRTLERTFHDQYNLTGDPTLFSVQFSKVSYCFNGEQVYFADTPQARVYLDSRYAGQLQGACVGANRSDTNARQPSVYITCNAAFSNKGFGTYPARYQYDTGNGSRFTIAPFLNFGLNLGSTGAVASPGGADQMRYFTLTINKEGCFGFSGVADPSVYCW